MKTNSNFETKEEREERLNRIASRILLLSRSSISINMRYLDPAVFQLIPSPGALSLGTDGRYLFYDPEYLISEYRKEKTTMTRDYMHVILHCIFQHNFIHKSLDKPYWDLACDIAVENLINQQNLACFQSERQSRQTQILIKMGVQPEDLTAEKLYRYFKDNHYSEDRVERMRDAFKADDHDIWYQEPDDKDGDGKPTPDNGDENKNNRPSKNQQQELQNPPEDQPPQSSQNDQEKKWKDISRQIQVDLETLSKEAGDQKGGMLLELQELHREKYDYTRFLQKFAVMGEQLMINDDEFDNIFYTYGLNLYGDMPLIEPLEYKEVKRIRDFVIAIDTSASTSGELTQKFLQKTFNILKESESFFSKVNIYVVQADVEITNVTQIKNIQDVDKIVENLELRGKGGTDFRPVFTYVNKLVKEQAFQRLKGILYFTDGYGPFPRSKPPYSSAFVFLRQEHEDPQVPPWAIKLILDEEDL